MRIKVIVIVLLLIGALFFTERVGHAYSRAISAEQAIVIDGNSGRVLFDKNSDEQRPIASITKVMTALLAIEYGNLKEKVTVSKEATEVTGSSIYLQPEEQITLEDLLYGLMLRSGNDAAMAIAEHIGGSVEGFVFLMNEKAKYLGMTNTNFMNPHGLDEEHHYSSAYDIALLMKHAIQNETFQKISSTSSYLSANRDYRWFNKNKLLTHLYPHCTGGKTGFTKSAGRTLVTTAEKEGISLIAVTLNAGDDWNDHITLYEHYFSNLKPKTLEKKGNRSISLQGDGEREVWIDESIVLPFLDEEISQLQKQIIVKKTPTTNRIGYLTIELDNKPVMTVPLYEAKPLIVPFFEEVRGLIPYIVGYDVNG